MDGNKTVTANFSEIPTVTYTLTVNSSNGSVTKSPDKTNYTDGETVTLTPTADTGYEFDSWSGDASGTAASVEVVMDGNKTVTANFLEVALASSELSLIQNKLLVYPNPGMGLFNISFSSEYQGDVLIFIHK
jgi:uncharacterized repeat protein (TIGR02543 family)